jgi:hypothetical protein
VKPSVEQEWQTVSAYLTGPDDTTVHKDCDSESLA